MINFNTNQSNKIIIEGIPEVVAITLLESMDSVPSVLEALGRHTQVKNFIEAVQPQTVQKQNVEHGETFEIDELFTGKEDKEEENRRLVDDGFMFSDDDDEEDGNQRFLGDEFVFEDDDLMMPEASGRIFGSTQGAIDISFSNWMNPNKV